VINISRKNLFYIKEELLSIVNIYGTKPHYYRLKNTFQVNERYSKKIFLDRVIFYFTPSIIYLLEKNKQKKENDLYILHILFDDVENINPNNKEFKYSIKHGLYRLYDYKKYYTQNQNEYGEYNENKIFNKQ